MWVHWNLIEAIHEHSLQLGAWAAVEEPKSGRGGLMKPSACMRPMKGAISGNPWQSVAISGNQWRGGLMKPSVCMHPMEGAISGTS